MGANIFSMPAASTALLLSFAFGLTSAMPWNGPEETKVYRAVDFSPKPTGVPVEAAGLLKRDTWVPVNVCGWIAGRPESVARCGSGSSCIHDTAHQVLGCCATAGPCHDGVYTTCLDSGMDGWKSTQGMINNGVLSCKPSSTCFQNSFSGNYKQFSCGESDLGKDIQTSYDGKGNDVRLQIVYTGISFSAMSKPLYTTVPFDNQATVPAEAGKANPTSTEAPGSQKSRDEETTGYIAGGTIGGVAVAAIAIAGIILYLRRRKMRKGQRVGGFVSLDHHEEKPPTAGPFKRLTGRYSAHDFGPITRRSTAQEIAYMSPTADGTTYISPLTGHPNDSHAPYNIPHERNQAHYQNGNLTPNIDRDLLSSPMSASTYNGAFPETYDTSLVPTSRLNMHTPSPQLLPMSDEQSQPLVGTSINEFGHNWKNTSLPLGYGNLNHQKDQDTHIHSGDMPEGTDMGLVSTMRRAASQIVTGNNRTVDENMRSESFRHSKVGDTMSNAHALDFEDSIWNTQPMNPPVLILSTPESLGLGIQSSSRSSSRTLVDGRRNSGTVATGAGPAAGAEKPLMEQMMEAFNLATRVGGEPSVVVKKDVYQLVDEGIASGSSHHNDLSEMAELNAAPSPRTSLTAEPAESQTPRPAINRGSSSATLLRKPVGGTVLRPHRRGASEGGLI